MAFPPAPGFESPDLTTAPPVSPDVNTAPPVSPTTYDAGLAIPLPDHGLPLPEYGMDGQQEEGEPQGEEDLVMAIVKQHATGECMPAGEGYLQNYLNSAMETTYTLKSLESICTVDSALAQSIIYHEMSSNFSNALGHVREARELFPDDEVFHHEDIWVLQHLRANWGEEDAEKKKKRFAFLPGLPTLPALPFGKKDKEAKARTKKANEAFEGEPDEAEKKKKTLFARLRRSPNKDGQKDKDSQKDKDASSDSEEGGDRDEETKEERKEKEKREKKEKAERKKQEKQEKKKTKKRRGSMFDDATPHVEEVAAS